MTDVRESVLDRLRIVAGGIPGIKNAFRNRSEVSERARPAIVILDADEAVADLGDESIGRGRPSRAPSFIGMTPEIYIMLSSPSEALGAEINALRALLIKAILTDAVLLSLVGANGTIRYEGCSTDLARGRQMQGDMGLSFTFVYVLNPARL